jgi:Surface antigen variable number repeat
MYHWREKAYNLACLRGDTVLRHLFHAGFFVVLGLLLPAASAQIAAPAPGPPSFHAIRNVSFDRVTVLSAAEQQKIRLLLQSEDPAWVSKQTPEALASFVQNVVLSSYEDKGYWRARVSALVTWVKGHGEQRQVDVLISAVSEGEPYQLKEIRWTGVNAFTEGDLLKLMPVHARDPASRTKIAEGLQAVRDLYASRGYVTLTVLPRLEFDDAAHSAVLNIAVREDSPFRFGSLSVAGLDDSANHKLQQEWAQMREQTYSPDGLRRFLDQFVQQTPSAVAAPTYRTTSIDLDTHTVDILVTFPPATQAEKREQ